MYIIYYCITVLLLLSLITMNGGLKQNKQYLFILVVRTEMGLHGLNQGGRRTAFLLETLEENPFLAFLTSRGCLHLWHLSPFSSQEHIIFQLLSLIMTPASIIKCHLKIL